MSPRLVALLACCLPALAPSPCRAAEGHYLLMFGSQQVPNRPNHAHSFATFVRVSWPDPGCAGETRLECVTISWLAATLKVRTLSLLPEPGVNLGLHETLTHVLNDCQRVSIWGPYRVEPELYALAVKERDHLESGAVRYKPIDSGRDSHRISNCIHALANVIDARRVRVASPGWGETASHEVLRSYSRRGYLNWEESAPWLIGSLGLDRYPLIYRDRRRPYSGALVVPFYRALGGERGLTATYGPP